jgi:1,4-alpha-glucan branching enzyme
MTNNTTNKKVMKKNKVKENGNGKTHAPQSIRIEFTHLAARTVAIAGTFNDWRPEATQMVQVNEGRWIKDLALPPGTYEYRLVVDGVWMADPRGAGTVPNPFGESNSVLNVGPASG